MSGRLNVLRIAVAISALSCSILVGLDLIGWIPGKTDELARRRVEIGESLVMHATVAATLDEMPRLRTLFEISKKQHEDVLSVALRDRNGRLLSATRDHTTFWRGAEATGTSATHMRLPIYNDGEVWASLEVRFRSAGAETILAEIWNRPATRIMLLMFVLGTLGNALLLRRIFRYLDPSQVVPARVRTALDAMFDGVALIDPDERIVLANKAFCESVDQSESELLGMRISALEWRGDRRLGEERIEVARLPWNRSLESAKSVSDIRLELGSEADSDEILIFEVAASPILDSWEKAKGAIVSFKDVSELERNRRELEVALVELEKSQDEIRLQNEELQVLAQTDPLTGLANRRTFMEWFERRFESAQSSGERLSVVMVDVDHFKRVNDQYGHSMGDDVIVRVAQLLKQSTRDTDIACRYGGEEFCLAIRERNAASAAQFAERLRIELAAPGFAEIPITASFGISSTEFGAATPLALIDEADQALYAAKEGGRNRVAQFGDSA